MTPAHRPEATRRTLLAALAAAGLASPLGALAQSPSGLSTRPIRFLLAQTPGTSPDIIARILAPRIQALWGQPVVVENRAGAAGAIGLEALAHSPPDGHTITINPSSTLTLPLFFPLGFDMINGLKPVTIVGDNIFVFTVHVDAPGKDLREFLAWAKSQGGRVNYGSPGNGTHHHLFMEQFKLAAGVQMTHIPYKGSAQAFTDLMGGQISAMFVPVGAALTMARDGRVRILGGSSKERSPLNPDIPSIAEQGVPGFDMNAWFSALVPSATPPDIMARWNTLMREVLAEPGIREALGKQGIRVIGNSAEEADRVTRAEYQRFVRLVKAANIKGD
jgi:tripartite-type tricarboxylate transporter receptor subunit TctC